jgi:hypothetical protein
MINKMSNKKIECEKKEIRDQIQKRIDNTLLTKITREIIKVKDNNRMLVLVTHGFIELLINALIDHNLKNSKKVTNDERSYPHATKLLILNELGLIDDNWYKVFNWFRKLRNRAAHQPLFKLTKDDLKYIGPKEYQNPENFYELCMLELIAGFWNEHIPIFGPIFAPGLDGEESKS